MSPPPAAAPPASASEPEHANDVGLGAPQNSQPGLSAGVKTGMASDTAKQLTASAGTNIDIPVRPKLQRQYTDSSEDFQSADEGEEEIARTTATSEESGKGKAGKSGVKTDADVGGSTNGDHSKTRHQPGTDATVNDHSFSVKDAKQNPTSDIEAAAENPSQSEPSALTLQTSSDSASNRPKDGTKASTLETSKADALPEKDNGSKKVPDETTERPSTPTDPPKSPTESRKSIGSPSMNRRSRADSHREIGGVSEWSHQVLAPPTEDEVVEEELTWQDMPTDSRMDYYDDFGHLVAKADKDWEANGGYDAVKGGAGKGYTRVQLDDDAQSATSMDEQTSYLFTNKGGGTNVIDEGDEESRDALSQMQATKDLLTEGQRIAYVGVTRLAIEGMRKDINRIQITKKFKKEHANAAESLTMWSQKMMVRLYAHMDISSSEQVMIEQLAEHGIQPSDMTQALMQNARVKNPLAEKPKPESEPEPKPESEPEAEPESKAKSDENPSQESGRENGETNSDDEVVDDPPPPYTAEEKAHVPENIDPASLEKKENLDLDLRWTVLCDLFLVLIADSVYDARSRVLLEHVGEALEIPWIDICRFEKRVTDALEMQEEAATEDWDESETIESRRKQALKKRYLMMGLATAGGGLLIGLSAGILAPVIGAGLAAGFSAVGVAGTSGFLAGAGGAAIITTSSAIAGGSIAVKASSRRMGAVRTFEYRPLHNNKRVNLIVTISGWKNGKIDDVRLPFSTVDPIMGDIYSIFWEPEMLESMGDTMRILATEALTQGLQQALGVTFLSTLMGGLTAPLMLTKLSYLIDNPWSSSVDRAERAGLILADSIIDRHLGVRPITLVGFSLGSRIIFSCLNELASRGAYGLVQNAYLFGSPLTANKEDWIRARTVVSGRLVNGYATTDWILGYLFRATSGGLSRVAGLAAVQDVPGLENFDCTKFVNGHMAYRAAIPRLLRELGWEVISDEFTEIEDPDPENHEVRQRELIREIEDARQQAREQQQTTEKRRWWGGKRKQAEKKNWETYSAKGGKDTPPASPAIGGGDDNYNRNAVLFDIDAIRRELESEHMEVKQLESTLPPMQLNLQKPEPPISVDTTVAHSNEGGKSDMKDDNIKSSTPKTSSLNPFAAFRGTKSNNAAASDTPKSPKDSKAAAGIDKGKNKDGAKESRSAAPYDYDESEDADPALNGHDVGGGITMSFERPHSPDDVGWESERSRKPASEPASTTPARVSAGEGTRPSGLGIEHNAWADDETHGEEGEITMSFA